MIAGLAAVAVAAAPWLSRPWRRAVWATLLLIAAARLITGGLSPVDLVLAVAAGVAVGAGLLVVFGVPAREVTVASTTAKGSRPFRAVTEDGQGRAHYELGRHFPPDHPGRQAHLSHACEIFAGIGASYELTHAQAAMSR